MPETSPTGEDRLRIREMTIDDFAEVFHLGEKLFPAGRLPSLYRIWDEYEITTLFNMDNELCLVAEGEGAIVGFALGTTVEKQNSPWKYGYLVWMGVQSDWQRRGVGDRLFREIRRRMQGQGVRILLVDTAADNEAAIAFLEKKGFGDVQEHVYMTLNLTRRARKKTAKQR